MCGIAGGFNLSREIADKMCAHQNSRGPDSSGIKEIGNVIFGHTRLSIIDKSERSNQPLSNEKSMMTYNGEIYSGLDVSQSDTLALWNTELLIKFGENEFSRGLNSINGMFGIAWYENDVIYLIRDRFGIKPLYYTHQKDFFAFASTPAAVALTKNNWNVSEKGLQEYLSLGATMLHSMFAGIEAVPPGHYVTFNCKTNEVKVKRWYYPKFIENAFETIEEKVIQAIERVKLTCDWPQVILLSGGIDSTLVASRYQGQKAIHLESPEKEFAERVANRFGIWLENVHPHDFSVEECLLDYTSKCGDPTMAGFIPYITCKEIKKLGFRVAITANGADELFFGYDRMRDRLDQEIAIFRDFGFNLPINFAVLNDKFYDNGLGHSQWFEICSYLIFDLNKTLDFSSMCHSVEVRVPYLDHELVEAALSIPMDKHVGKFGNKTILKKMLVDLGFDFSFIHRPKVGFSLHHEPSDLQDMKNKAMKWYNSTEYPKLAETATARQEAYHEMTVLGLYMWHQIYKP
jgi:asparagine synthase (glutamine-hydrolysing)